MLSCGSLQRSSRLCAIGSMRQQKRRLKCLRPSTRACTLWRRKEACQLTKHAAICANGHNKCPFSKQDKRSDSCRLVSISGFQSAARASAGFWRWHSACRTQLSARPPGRPGYHWFPPTTLLSFSIFFIRHPRHHRAWHVCLYDNIHFEVSLFLDSVICMSYSIRHEINKKQSSLNSPLDRRRPALRRRLNPLGA